MKTELLAWLINATSATSLACLAVVLLRKPLQRWLGAEIAFRLWIAIPLAAIAACFPPPRHGIVQVAATQSTASRGAESPAAPWAVQVTHALSGIAADRWLLTVWLAGAVALVLVFAWQQRRYVARLRLRPAGDGSWRSGSESATPAVLGLIRQRLVLPERFEADYSDEDRRLVIAHERMHQHRRDPWALAACALLRVMFWFNPIVHLAASLFRRDVELACDAAVLRAHPQSRRRYADALFKAELAAGTLPVGCQWHLTPPMKERIMLLKQKHPSRRARGLGILVLAIAGGGATCVALASHDTAMGVAAALAVHAGTQSSYLVKLDMSVDGKPTAQPHLLVRPGDEAVVRIDDHGRPWGLRFRVTPAAGSKDKSMRIAADVFTGDERHVIGHPQLGLLSGTPGVIELNDPHAATPRPVYRIAATISPAAALVPPTPPLPPTPPGELAAPPAPPSMMAPVPPTPPPAPRAQGSTMTEEREIVVNGPEATPLPPEPPLAPGVAAPQVNERIVIRQGPHAALAPLPPLPALPPLPPNGQRVSITVHGPAGSTAPPAPSAPETPGPDEVAPPAPPSH